MYTFDTNEIERHVFDKMRSIGCEPINHISFILDGHIHRYNVIGDKRRDETIATDTYIIHDCIRNHKEV
ncbi:MAG: hypothetical protein II832_09980 [Synergistaceae bacterium]|nr:hypothetical protein [Synergistaceae bacterium]